MRVATVVARRYSVGNSLFWEVRVAMRISIRCLWSITFCLIVLWSAQTTWAQNRTGAKGAKTGASTAKDPVEASHLEHSLSGEELEALTGKTFDLLLKNGKKEAGCTIKDFLCSKQLPDRFRTIVVTLSDGKKTRKIQSEQVFQLEQEGKVYTVAYLPTQKYHVLIDVAKRDAAIAAKLESEGNEIWAAIPDAEQEKYTAEERAFAEQVKTHFTALNMQSVETKFFIFVSDMPPAQLSPYLKQLDTMCDALGQAFGFPPGHNVWRGKAVIVAFVKEESFVEFEKKFMEHTPNLMTTQGLCHQLGEGRVVVSAYRGNSPEYFGSLLVHETAHGYVHRYKSTADIPSWFNEGISDWIAALAVPSDKSIAYAQRQALVRLQQNGSLGGNFFTSEQIQPWQYGVASSMVEMLVKISPDQFRLFFNGIKEGLTWEDSLMRAYGMTPEDLTSAYGRAVGLPELMP